ncbi:twin-arginine translocase TatA/TatE family subunit [Campylobacter corcagiensis]|uniref:Sec-independent protein translocase protein TatA n=1 Tax=Campylobacter corcagiensis TaxID=1448857 RepID=A0A7M1LGT7_9BACT|nr:twin-arginine translocase TatA/TatE family subunit [Campylobacter corcagiensis]QKF64257.1 twin arginine translocation system, TatA/E family protein [Campylobacter corcagiensis]QOQ87553.1 twin-arginine translocase TatA/TatE family subunit [Campylobacter corcagiensis]
MGAMSMGHWLIVLVIIVLLFGSKKIPELAQGLGKGIKTFKKEMDDIDEEESKKSVTEEKKVESTETKDSEKV